MATLPSAAPVPPPPPAPEADSGPGFLGRLIGLYVAPIETMRAIASRPTIVAPLLALVVVNTSFTQAWLRLSDHAEVARIQMEEAGVFDRIPPEQHAAVVERQARMMPIFAMLGPTVFLPVMLVALAALFLFVYRFFYAADTTFTQSMAVICWCFLASYFLLTVLTTLVLVLKGDWNVDPRTVIQASPAAIVERASVGKPLHRLLDSLDLFSAWTMFLLSAGYAATAKRSVGSAAVGVVVLWAIYVAMNVGLAAIF